MGNHWPSFLVIFSWVHFLLDSSVLVFSCSALRDFIFFFFFLLSQVSYIWDGHELSTVAAIRIFVQPQKEAIKVERGTQPDHHQGQHSEEVEGGSLDPG